MGMGMGMGWIHGATAEIYHIRLHCSISMEEGGKSYFVMCVIGSGTKMEKRRDGWEGCELGKGFKMHM